MRVYQRAENGPWIMEGEVAGHRFHKSTRLRDHDEAEQYMLRYAETKRLESLGIMVIPTAPPPETSLHKICERWGGLKSNEHSGGHLLNVSDHVRLHFQDFAHLPVNEITPLMWEVMKNEFLKTHKPSTYNGLARSFNLLMHWAKRTGLIKEIPFLVSKVRVKKRPRKIVHFDDYARLAEICDRHPNPVVGGLVRFILGTGVRLTEALAARWEYFDERSRTYVPQGQEEDDGTKGGEAEHMPMPDRTGSSII